MKTALFTSLLFLAASAGAQNRFVYVNNQSPNNTISGFMVNADGSLTQLSSSPFQTAASGGGSAEAPEGLAIVTLSGTSYLYAANNGAGSISTFTIDPQSGNLQLTSGSPFLLPDTSGVYYIAASPDNQFLFATNRGNTLIHVLAIGQNNGSLSEVPGSPFAANANLTGLSVTPQHFLIAGEISSNAIQVYSVSSSGSLTPVSGSPFAASSELQIVQSNCHGNQVFAEGFNTTTHTAPIDVYSMQDGVLTPAPGSPYSNGSGRVSWDLALSPNNSFLFTADTFGAEISSFDVARNGSLQAVPGSPFSTGSWEGGLAVTAAGDYLYSVDFGTGNVDGRSIGPNGTLTAVPGTPFPDGFNQSNGSSPMSVIAYPAPTCSSH